MSKIERTLERGLFASRWLMAPFYVGLVGALIVLLCSFMQEFVHFIFSIPNITSDEAVLGVLALIDLSLAGNLVLIVIFSGYENFVSKFDVADIDEKLEWQGTVDFSDLKLKLVASIVAISGIQLLKVFMNVEKITDREAMWMVVIHLVFVVSGVFMAYMDKIAVGNKAMKKK